MTAIPPNVCVGICIPHYGRPHSRYVDSIERLWKPSSVPGAMIPGLGTHKFQTTGKPISLARNEMTRDALGFPEITHLLWVDDDMEFPAHALKRLLEHDVPIVGGLCHSRHFPYHPILGKVHHDGRKYGFCFEYPADQLFEVDVTGGAFLLVKREVYEKLNAAGYELSWWNERDGASEDFSFCELARQVGYKVLVDTGLDIGHVAEIVINRESAKKLRPPFHWNAWTPDPGVPTGEAQATIVIPTYNQDPKLLRKAVFSASHQTVPVEVIIVDDGSMPPIPFEGWPDNVQVIRHARWQRPFGHEETLLTLEDAHYPISAPSENRGIAAALNTGIHEMKTKWFCWLSSDDLLDPRKVEVQLSLLRQTGGKLSFHRYQEIGDRVLDFSRYSLIPNWRTMDEQRQVLAQACAINGSTVMIAKEVFDDLGGFDEHYRYGQDWEFWARAGQKYFWYGIDEILGTRREGGNLTEAIEKSAADDERRLRRDAEDSSIKARYAWPR